MPTAQARLISVSKFFFFCLFVFFSLPMSQLKYNHWLECTQAVITYQFWHSNPSSIITYQFCHSNPSSIINEWMIKIRRVLWTNVFRASDVFRTIINKLFLNILILFLKNIKNYQKKLTTFFLSHNFFFKYFVNQYYLFIFAWYKSIFSRIFKNN